MTRYYADGIRPIYETKADGSLNADLERDIFGNLLARQDAGGARYYYHHDGLGSTVGLTDASGAVAAQRTYDAWGNRRTSSGAAPGNYQFTGAELDPTSGLYHMGARFYDPTIGRWLSEDPVQDNYFEPGSLNFYAYVSNNPVLLTDPLGLEPTPEGIQRAAETLQDFIDALIALNDLIEALKLRGITSITIAGHSISLASLQQAVNFLSTRAGAVVYSGIKKALASLYITGNALMAFGAVTWLVGAIMFKRGRNKRSRALGATLMAYGVTAFGTGAAMYGLAWLLDMILTGGDVRKGQ